MAEWRLLSNAAKKEKEASNKAGGEGGEDICWRPDLVIDQKQFEVKVGEGFFDIQHLSGEVVSIRNLGTAAIEVSNSVEENGKLGSVFFQ